MAYFRWYWSHLGHINDHMSATDGSCDIRILDSWILRLGPYSLCHQYGHVHVNESKGTYASVEVFRAIDYDNIDVIQLQITSQTDILSRID